MANAKLTIDLSAIAKNWRELGNLSNAETAAVVKADAYGLGVAHVAPALAAAGARSFFVANAEEGSNLRDILGFGPRIFFFSGHMPGDAERIRASDLIPLNNSIDQMLAHVENLPGHPFGVQLDTGMNRLGMETAEWAAIREIVLKQNPVLIMSHLACSDAPQHMMNSAQLMHFQVMTQGLDVPRSLSATGGIMLDDSYHFDLTRPGVGLYGGLPFDEATPVVQLDVPVIQIRDVLKGESVGYANSWTASRPTRVATIAAGYADGLVRAMGSNAYVIHDGIKLPVIGRVSMDMITIDVTDVEDDLTEVELIGQHQSIDTVASYAGTIGYEILTSLGSRYSRTYIG